MSFHFILTFRSEMATIVLGWLDKKSRAATKSSMHQTGTATLENFRQNRCVKVSVSTRINKSQAIIVIFSLFFSGLFFDKHLKYIKLSEKFVDFSKKDLSYLLKDIYDENMVKNVYRTPVVTVQELKQGLVKEKGPVRIQYNNRNQFKEAARMLGIMDDFKVRVN